MLKYIETGSKFDCYGCNACVQACSHDALEMKADEEGFLYPILSSDNCINCGLCEKVCPINRTNEVVNEIIGKSFASQIEEIKPLKQSSSGGIFYAIAFYILNNGGVVYGCAFDERNQVQHKRIDRISEIIQLQGSKYVQSAILDTYKNVRKDLKENKTVYFTGTPCQIAGLKTFLIKDYENLITSDIICHGVPSPKLFSLVIQNIENKNKGKVISYLFRDKRIRGWACSSTSCSLQLDKGGIRFLKYSPDMEAYFNAFHKGYIMRYCCYKCPFSQPYRAGDITLGDFWGVRKSLPKFPNIPGGVSLTICNTEVGKKIINLISKNYRAVEIPFATGADTNPNLRKSTPLSPQRKSSYKLAFEKYHDFVTKYGTSLTIQKKIRLELEYYIRKHSKLFNFFSLLMKKIK